MHEDYGGNLAVKAGDGTWAEGTGGDGAYRNGVRVFIAARRHVVGISPAAR
jgi:hypothetical protein